MKARGPISLFTLLLLFVLLVQVRLWLPNWDTHNVTAILSWDVMGYYLYLPAHFIYHDLGHLGFIDNILREYAPTGSFYQAFPVEGMPGQFVMKYTCGLALLWTPFFWLGHWAASWFGYPQDGFSAPYQVAIAFGGVLYAVLGLGVLRRVLLRFFSDVATALVLIMLVGGSNFLQYAVSDTAMPHIHLFTGYALLLWLTMRWHEHPRHSLALLIGLNVGVMALIRPVEAVSIVIPLLWGITSAEDGRAKLGLLRHRWPDVVLLALGGLAGILPQLLYWKWATGHFIFDSYQNTSQQFNFLQPHLWPVLFSFRKGWLIYSPLLLLALAGFVPLWRRHRYSAVPALVYFVLNLWLVSAWEVWWYAGSLGQRALVQSYAVLALPWGAATAWLLAPQRRPALRFAAAAVALLLIDLNLFQHWQYAQGLLQYDGMTRRFYGAIFNNTRLTQADYALLDVKTHLPRAERYYQARVLAKLDFEQLAADTAVKLTPGFGFESNQSYLKKSNQRSPILRLRLADYHLQPSQWLRLSCQVWSNYGAWDDNLTLNYEQQGQPKAWQSLRLHNTGCHDQRWNKLWFDWPVPADAQPDDVLNLFVEGAGATCNIDDIQVETLEPKTN